MKYTTTTFETIYHRDTMTYRVIKVTKLFGIKIYSVIMALDFEYKKDADEIKDFFASLLETPNCLQ